MCDQRHSDDRRTRRYHDRRGRTRFGGPAVRRAIRNANRARNGPRDDRQGHGAAAGPTGPTGRRHAKRTPHGATGERTPPSKRGAFHGDHQEGPEHARAHVGPAGLAHALAHAVDPRKWGVGARTSRRAPRISRYALSSGGSPTRPECHGTRPGHAPALVAGGPSRWSGVSTPPRHDTQVLGRRSSAAIYDRAATGERKARPVALRGRRPHPRPVWAPRIPGVRLLASAVGS
jgi:hypothetical protein